MKILKSPAKLPEDYTEWLGNLKQRIIGARQKAILSANHEQIQLYHDIGSDILKRQSQQGWGTKVINQISADLCAAFPDMKGFSSRNLKYMSFFAKICPDCQIGQQSAAQLPWFHIVTLLTKITDPTWRGWYAEHAVQLNFYLAAVDAQVKAPDDKSTIGLLLCKTKKRLVAEYALSGIDKPMGVAEYQLVRSLPKPLDTNLPTIEELETELSRNFDGKVQ